MSLHLKLSVNAASTQRQQSVNRVSTEHQQSVNRASTERQQSVNRASTERQQSVNRASTEGQQSVNRASTERQQSINEFGCCIVYNARAVLRNLPIIKVWAAFIGKIVNLDVASTLNERQQSINRASTILGVASSLIRGLCYGIYPWSTFWQFLCSKETATWSQPDSENERQQSINEFGCCIF